MELFCKTGIADFEKGLPIFSFNHHRINHQNNFVSALGRKKHKRKYGNELTIWKDGR